MDYFGGLFYWRISSARLKVLVWSLYVSFGLVDFAVVAPTIKLLATYFKGPSLGVVTGLLYMSHQLGSAIGSYVPGLLFDQTGSYLIFFTIAAILLGLASFFSFLLPKQKSVKQVHAA